MVDLSNQQFYEYNEENSGSTGGRFSSLFSRRNIIIGGIILLIIVLIIVMVVLLGGGGESEPNIAEEGVDTIVERRLSDCVLEDDIEACKQRVYTSVARETGAVSLCDETSEELFRSCVTNVAYDQFDPDLCQSLDKDEQILCSDTVLLARAQRTLDIGSCDAIEDDDKKSQCNAIVEQEIILNEACEEYGLESKKCERRNRVKNAAIGDPALCKELENEDEVASCMELITSQDRDNDGLSSYDEFQLGTSDDNPDTDGDGYSDTLEVINNFDPLL